MNKILIISLIVGLLLFAGVYTYYSNDDESTDCSMRQIPDQLNIQKGYTGEKIYYDACYFEETGKLRRIE